MSSVVAAANAVSVFRVDAGWRGIMASCSATMLPLPSAMASEKDLPTPSLAENSSRMVFAAWASTGMDASTPAATVPPVSASCGSGIATRSTPRNVRMPGATS